MNKMDSCPYIEDGRLLDYAASAAILLRPQDNCAGAEAASLLRRDFLEIRRSHQAVEKRYGKLAGAPAACQWLLDNWYMVQREYYYAVSQLKAAKNLRCSPEGIMIMELCRVLVKAGQGQVTEERCAVFLEGFQSVTVLARRELELFPAALRCAIIEGIADVCRRLRFVSDTADCAQAFGRLFTSLRLFAVLDMEKLLRRADRSGQILAEDPVFEKMDSGTRREYLKKLEKLAKRRGMEEHILAGKLVKKAGDEGRHVGFYLFKRPSPFWAGLYIVLNILLPLGASLFIAFRLDSPAAAILLYLPVW